MTDHEKELIHIISNASDPERAVKIFADIIEYLKRLEASEAQVSAYLLTNYQKSLSS